MSHSPFKKPAVMCSDDFRNLFEQVSKAALIDALWCACQLGTDESAEQITTQAARSMVAALDARGDRIAKDMRAKSEMGLDSD